MNNPSKIQTASTLIPRLRCGLPARLFAKGWLPAVLLSANLPLAAQMPPIHPRGVYTYSTLTIGPTGNLNVQDNALIVTITPYAPLYTYVANGYDGGVWDGTHSALRSSTAASDPNHLTGLGIARNADLQYPSWWGQTLSLGTETLIQYTYYGDANLDGDVDATDLALLGAGLGWNDFNYDGVVNAGDYAAYNASLATLHPQSVPEPACFSLLAVGALMALRRRPAAR